MNSTSVACGVGAGTLQVQRLTTLRSHLQPLWSQSEIRRLFPIKLFFMPWLHQLAYLASHIGNVTHKIRNLNQLGQLLIFFLPQLPTQKLPALWKLASWKKTGTSVLSLAFFVFYNQSVCCLHQQSLVIWFWKARKGDGSNLYSFGDPWGLPGQGLLRRLT